MQDLYQQLMQVRQQCREIVSSVHGVIPAALINKLENLEKGVAIDAYREHRVGYSAVESIHYAAIRIGRSALETAELMGFDDQRYPSLFAKLK